MPERGSPLTRRLDTSLLADADAASDAAVRALSEIAAAAATTLRRLLRADSAIDHSAELDELARALDAVRSYLERIAVDPTAAETRRRLRQVLHTLDHLSRLRVRMQRWQDAAFDPAATVRADARLRRLAALLEGRLEADSPPGTSEQWLHRFVQLLRRRLEPFRERTIALASCGELTSPEALARLDAFRWLLRVADHLARIALHSRLATELEWTGGGPIATDTGQL